jgi:dTDP-4-dehydrorhamnose reductase
MRVLVFGAAGQVGEELTLLGRAAGHDVVALTRAEHDITDAAATRARVLDTGADVVFNAAAYTAVDRAEQEPALAMAINGAAPGVIARAAAEAGSMMVHFSTDYVFDGAATSPIPEDAPTNPRGEYGRTKLVGEEAVLGAGGRAAVVRTAWVYGLHGANFIATVLRVTRERGAMNVVDDQRGSPTWARDLAGAALRLGEVGTPGVYHLTNAGSCTWFELATRVVELAGVSAAVKPITTADYPTPARRPAYSVLENRRWQELGEATLRPWDRALEEFIPALADGGTP